MAVLKVSTLLSLALAFAEEVKGKSLMQKGGPLPVLKKLDGLAELGDGESLLLEEDFEEDAGQFPEDFKEDAGHFPTKVDQEQCETTRTAAPRGLVASGILVVLSMLPEILSWATALIGMKIIAVLAFPQFFATASSCTVEDEDEDAWIDELPDDPPLKGNCQYQEEKDDFSCTALHVACHNASTSKVSELIALGADVNAREAWSETPLHMASRAGAREICLELLEAKADIDAKNADGRTPLIVAAQAKQDSVCELLLDYEAKADMADEDLPPLLSSLFLQRLLKPVA